MVGAQNNLETEREVVRESFSIGTNRKKGLTGQVRETNVGGGKKILRSKKGSVFATDRNEARGKKGSLRRSRLLWKKKRGAPKAKKKKGKETRNAMR